LRLPPPGDSSRISASELPAGLDPFAPPQRPTLPAPAPKKDRETTDPARFNLDKLGLKLTGTLLSAEKRLAVIGGRAYAVGQEIQFKSNVRLVVTHIEPRQVTVERDGQLYILKTGPATEDGKTAP